MKDSKDSVLGFHPSGRLKRALPIVGLMIALWLGAFALVMREPPAGAAACQLAGPIATMSALPEASGLAVSGLVPGRLWSHNDTGEPMLVALDANGGVTGRVQVTGATAEDWEAIAIGPCLTGSCVYLGDIGDNGAKRANITVYRLEEPSGDEPSVAVKDILHATYPDGPQDAEAMLVTPDGGLFIVTKGETGPVALYRFPRELRTGTTHMLERVGLPRDSGKPASRDRITDAAVSPDGKWAVLRTGKALTFHHTREFVQGDWRPAATIDLKSVDEPQGEGVAIGAGETVYLAGEGGGNSRPGTFARLTCNTMIR